MHYHLYIHKNFFDITKRFLEIFFSIIPPDLPLRIISGGNLLPPAAIYSKTDI